MLTVHRLIRLALPLVVAPVLVTTVFPQGAQQPAEQPRMINASADPLLKAFRFRSIGPASMGGRIDDLEVSESDPSVIYIGYAAGGVFKSENNGTTFQPVFETFGSASIGDIAIHPSNPNIVYVGTGEANNRQTTTFGDGIYKTTDGGKTFTHMGLKDTQFTNPHGLDDPGLYTSAYDMAMLGRELLRRPELAEIVRKQAYQPAWDGPALRNLNLFLGHSALVLLHGLRLGHLQTKWWHRRHRTHDGAVRQHI